MSKRIWLGMGLVLFAAVGGALRFNQMRQASRALDRAKRELAAGRTAAAREKLAELAARWPNWDEVQYHLGLCEQARGRGAAALAAWAKVDRVSPLAAKAAARRGRLLIDQGRFAPAEAVLEPALHAAEALDSSDATEVRAELELLYQFEGRTADARRLILQSWRAAHDPAGVLKKLYLFDKLQYPTEAVRTVLAQADPEDERVWLGRANLAVREGRFAEARPWLDQCQARRPEDRVVWLSGLELARAANDVAGVFQAAQHLPADALPPVDILRLSAWLAERSGDPQAERVIWIQLLEQAPGEINALDRLADLAWKAGRRDEAERFRRRKDEINRARLRYGDLLEQGDPVSQAGEFAILAERMGRSEDARGWTLIRDQARTGQVQTREPLSPAVGNSAEASSGPGGDRRRRGGWDVSPRVSTTLADRLAPLRPPELRLPIAPTASPRDAGTLATAVSRSASASETRASRVPQFRDDAVAAGLAFLHDNGQRPGKPMFPMLSCGGVGVLDYDGDGWLDVYCVQGGPFLPDPRAARGNDRLFRNKGNGAFEDVTEQSGIAALTRGYGHGVAVGDYDNDGRPDLFLTRWRSYALCRNKGDGTFEDLTDRTGLGGDRDWPTSAVFADLDNDGDLDLYVCHYLVFDVDSPNLCAQGDRDGAYECSPRDYPALPDHIFRNDGGRFVDVSDWAGITAADRDGRGLGVLAADLDDDGRIDLFVANDTTANFLFLNRGEFRFEESALSAGVAANSNGGFQAGMGAACGDLDGDGRLDLSVTNFFAESTTFFRSLGPGVFADQTAAVGLAAPSRFLLGFGIVFLDVNNDSRLDLLTANGHINDRRPQYPWTMPAQLLIGTPGGKLQDVTHQAGPSFQSLHLGRGLAAADLDNDGRIDALLLAQNEPLVYLHNQTPTEPERDRSLRSGHYLTLQLQGLASNRDGVGARVAVSAGGRNQVAARVGGGSFQSASDPRLHFGLGEAERIDWLEVRWPSGRIDRHLDLEADTGYLIREGEGRPGPLKGWRGSPRSR